MRKFVDGLVHVCQSGMALLLFKRSVNLRFPAFGQLLQGADIQIAVMEPALQLWQVLEQKTPVLPDGVATHGRHALAHVFFNELDQLLFGLRFGEGRSFHLVRCGLKHNGRFEFAFPG